jgi:hypothetical protein
MSKLWQEGVGFGVGVGVGGERLILGLWGGLGWDVGVWDVGVRAGERGLLLCRGLFIPVMSEYLSWNRLGGPSSSYEVRGIALSSLSMLIQVVLKV